MEKTFQEEKDRIWKHLGIGIHCDFQYGYLYRKLLEPEIPVIEQLQCILDHLGLEVVKKPAVSEKTVIQKKDKKL